jgi:hypothetical protein
LGASSPLLFLLNSVARRLGQNFLKAFWFAFWFAIWNAF